MIFPSLFRLYPISHILYRMPYIVYPIIAYPKKFFKNVQNLKNFKFSKKFKICIRFQKFQRGGGAKVQNWPHIILKNNARHRIKTIY